MKQNRFYEEGGKGLIHSKEEVTDEERKRAGEMWEEIAEE